MGKRNKLFLIILILIILAGGVLFVFYNQQNKKLSSRPTVSAQNNSFSYQGVEGKSALEVLKEKTTIKQVTSGLVTSINGRQADENKREFWAFIVNGKESQVGPADYMTQEGDLIEWKIQNY